MAGIPTSRHTCALGVGALVISLASCESRPLPPSDDGIGFGEELDGDAGDGDGDGELSGDSDPTTSQDPTNDEGEDGSESCITVVDELTINDATSPGSVDCVEIVTGDLTIGATTQLADLELLANLREVGGQLYVTGNTALASLSGLRKLERVDHLHLRRNHNLVDLHGLSALREVNHITVSKNAGLVDLAGLPSALAPNFVEIADNDGLESLDGLPVFEPPAQDAIHVVVEGNPNLVDLSGLSACCADQLATLIFDGNPALTDLHGLESFTHIDTLRLHDNVGLVRLEGLDDVVEIGTLDVSYDHCTPGHTASLVDFSGAPNLAQMDVVQIEWVASLTSLTGLDSVASLSKLLIRNNAALPWDAILEFEARTEPALLDICGGIGGPECPHDPCPMF